MSTVSPDAVAGEQIRAFVERIERVQEEIDALNGDKKEIYAEAKGNGFNTKVLKRIVQIRKMDQNERLEEDALLELYLTALGMTPGADDEEEADPSRARAGAREAA
jgi:uncharacterized protein (UPF0335 family)